MRVHIGGNKVIITTEPKTVHFDLPKIVDNNLKYEINSTTKHNELLAERIMKTKLVSYCSNRSK